MAKFRVKSLAPFFIDVMGIQLSTNENVDLMETYSVEEIKASLMFGELYDKIQGRMITIPIPSADITSLSLTDAEYNLLTYCGFFQGRMGEEDLKYPFKFSNDGYLTTQSTADSRFTFSGDNLNVIDDRFTFSVDGYVKSTDLVLKETVESSDTFISYATIGTDKNIVSALGKSSRQILIGSGGDLVVLSSKAGAVSQTLYALPSGAVLNISVNVIYSSGTTAQNITVIG